MIRIAPTEGISFDFQAKKDGPGFEPEPERMNFSDGDPSVTPDAYERLLHDAMLGDQTLFTRRDGVERAWELVEPVLDHPGPRAPVSGRLVGTAGGRGADRAPRMACRGDRGGGVAPTVTGVIDVSLEIGPDLLVWPGNPGVVDRPPTSRISRGDSSNVSEIRLGSHTGTHIDPPFHFLDDGATADDLPLDVMIGETTVADLRGTAGPIGPGRARRSCR